MSAVWSCAMQIRAGTLSVTPLSVPLTSKSFSRDKDLLRLQFVGCKATAVLCCGMMLLRVPPCIVTHCRTGWRVA